LWLHTEGKERKTSVLLTRSAETEWQPIPRTRNKPRVFVAISKFCCVTRNLYIMVINRMFRLKEQNVSICKKKKRGVFYL
jgi:hypothetical protein